jgi:hypothetical protein
MLGLANITFAWMVDQVRPYLAFEEFTNASVANYLQRMVETGDEQALRKKEEPPSGVVGKLSGAVSSWFNSNDQKTLSQEKLVRTYCFSPSVVPTNKPLHWTLFRTQDSYSLMYQAISAPEIRKPGAGDDRSTESRMALSKLGRTNEYIHPSVKWRVDQSKEMEVKKGEPKTEQPDTNHKDFRYEPESLAGFEHKRRDGIYGWENKSSNVFIPEWPIVAALKDGDPSVYDASSEMALVDQCKDKDHVRKFLRTSATAWENMQPNAK